LVPDTFYFPFISPILPESTRSADARSGLVLKRFPAILPPAYNQRHGKSEAIILACFLDLKCGTANALRSSRMSTFMFALALGVTAFYVWVTVRAFNRREQWAKRIACTVFLVPVFYYASCGPLLYFFYRLEGPAWMEPVLACYEPVVWITKTSDRLRTWHKAYIGWWLDLATPNSPDDSTGDE
jgi:hypothetical protein